MNTFYFLESNIYETIKQVEYATKNYTCKYYDEFKTNKSYDEIERAYDECRANGGSCIDFIEWAV